MIFTKRTYRRALWWHWIAKKATAKTGWYSYHHHSFLLIHRRAARAGITL